MREEEYRERLNEVEEEIRLACEKAGRAREEVTLIAVSKTKPVSMIQSYYDLGLRHFGENRPQELRDKTGELPANISWHQIGHLQKNKIKYVLGRACLIHSVDSLSLAEELSKEAVKRDLCADVLLEINVAKEESKSGFTCEEILPLLPVLARLPGLRIKGLMTIAPFVDDPEENRSVFRSLRNLSVDIAAKNIDNIAMSVLSMGMTNDFCVAIEEGATMVRIGTALFGERG